MKTTKKLRMIPVISLGKTLCVTHNERKIYKKTITTSDFFEEKEEDAARKEIITFLINPDNTMVGPRQFDSVSLKKIDTRWVLELISIEETD